MLVHFHIHYFPNEGEVLTLHGSAPETGSFQETNALEMHYLGDGYWDLSVNIQSPGFLEYRYVVRKNGETKRREWGEPHRVGLPENTDICTLYDFWQPESDMRFLYSSAYTNSLLAIDHSCSQTAYAADHVILKVQAPFVKKGQSIGISGSIAFLGEWKEGKALKMKSERFPEWSISLKASTLPESFNYKFVVLDDATGQTISWEWGEPRSLFTPRCMDRQMLMHSGMVYHFQEAPWKGAGVAIPVFSLRSEDSWGCGDFGDLKKMADWAELTGQQMIQILPVNDTTLSETWLDSYPYNVISAFALHPIYASIKELPRLKDAKKMIRYEAERQALNALPSIDYEKVLRLKWEYFQAIFSQEGTTVFETESYQSFYEKNADWLIPYAAFCFLRKKYETHDFSQWGEYTTYNYGKIRELTDQNQPWYKDISIHYFVQYQLHIQLSAARDYAHAHSLILKGDVPIGICRSSVETWTEPQLFNMDSQIGAPPDDFSVKGQNWGFPSYNWERMKAEDLRWWKRRFQKMADYFDAYRIDHILGFFRIWEIPLHAVEGLLGHFSPALPINIDEMANFGFIFDEKKMTEPYINEELLKQRLGKSWTKIRDKYLINSILGGFQLKPDFETQQKIVDYFRNTEDNKNICEGLISLCNEVLFVRDPKNQNLFHPRISGARTECYQSMTINQKEAFDQLYADFFYARNVEFWEGKALDILPTLIGSTNMLVCGEDLGMIPACVPKVMHDLGILSLEIQRMPKKFGALFENLNSIPYQSVCTTSTHDMNPIRAWWHENPDITQQFYQQVLWKKGNAPKNCTPEIAEEILRMHLASPAIWVVFPWQDWLSFDKNLRHPDPDAERINIPDHPRHYWRYRMHISLEQLLGEKAFNENIRKMVKNAGRCQ
ncbi:MAG: 4-alpha-glucanotransferase [Bacteroidales bacterium]|nr:4-alpha-glucanotransferase [Bacteroidales bacterium]